MSEHALVATRDYDRTFFYSKFRFYYQTKVAATTTYAHASREAKQKLYKSNLFPIEEEEQEKKAKPTLIYEWQLGHMVVVRVGVQSIDRCLDGKDSTTLSTDFHFCVYLCDSGIVERWQSHTVNWPRSITFPIVWFSIISNSNWISQSIMLDHCRNKETKSSSNEIESRKETNA